jgi:hypothetical protein
MLEGPTSQVAPGLYEDHGRPPAIATSDAPRQFQRALSPQRPTLRAFGRPIPGAPSRQCFATALPGLAGSYRGNSNTLSFRTRLQCGCGARPEVRCVAAHLVGATRTPPANTGRQNCACEDSSDSAAPPPAALPCVCLRKCCAFARKIASRNSTGCIWQAVARILAAACR